MTDIDSLIILDAYVRTSSYRSAVFTTLTDIKYQMPSEIARNTNIRTNHISMVLKQLKQKNLIECINEDARKGRIYRLTGLGQELAEFLEENKKQT